MDEWDQLQRHQQEVEKKWRQTLEKRVQEIVEKAASERAQRVQEETELHKKTETVRMQLQAQGVLIDELERYHEFQKHAILLQEDALKSKSLEKEVEILVRLGVSCNEQKSLSGDDPILIHLLGNLPSSIVENGLPSTMHYYEKFFFLPSFHADSAK